MEYIADEETLPSFALQKHTQAADQAPSDDSFALRDTKAPLLLDIQSPFQNID